MKRIYLNPCLISQSDNTKNTESAAIKRLMFMPSAYYKALQDVPFADYYMQGYRYLFVDIDNTLMPHGSMHATEAAQMLIKQLQSANFQVILFSNAVQERLGTIAKELGVNYIKQANKPAAKKLLAYIRQESLVKDRCLIVGDQLITDVWAANKAGINSIWLEPISSKELWHIRLKRRLEAYLSKKYGFERHFDWILLEKKPKMR